MSCRDLLQVPEFPDHWVGHDGTIWRCRRGRLRPLKLSNRRYVQVNAKDQTGRWRCHYAHAFVLLAFAGPRPPGAVARHLNGVKADNRPENLRWGSRQENVEDAKRHGAYQSGEAHPNSKLNWEKVEEARKEAARGVAICELAKRYGVADSTMGAVVRGETWKEPPCQTPDGAAA